MLHATARCLRHRAPARHAVRDDFRSQPDRWSARDCRSASVFVSNEITAYFPEDGCKVHVLSWNITETQFQEIQRIREDIVQLRDYLNREGIAHACAHPLYNINDRLTIEHFERLLLLFNVFEVMNGGRHE